MFSYLRRSLAVLGAGLLGLSPTVASASEDGLSTLYVEKGDAHLLYEGQLPPGSEEAPVNPFKASLQTAYTRYIGAWAGLEEIRIPAGGTLAQGASGSRVALLRQRLGMAPGSAFDAAMTERVRLFRAMHGLSAGGQVDSAMVTALNRGHRHYTRILERNLRHADELPAYLGYRYVHVDLTNQRLQMVEDGQVIDSMAVVAGKPNSQTPVMAGLLRHAVLKPYWNVPADLVRDRYARRIINGGQAYLRRTGFQVMSDFTHDATVVPASSIDWRAVERGDFPVRLRQKPGPGNGMGDVKFMFPNALGIYLHDTASTQLFSRSERLYSAGCVRVERPMDFGRWLFNGEMPQSSGMPEEQVNMPFPVPIYITYFTAVPDGDRIAFRSDIYNRDARQFAQLSN